MRTSDPTPPTEGKHLEHRAATSSPSSSGDDPWLRTARVAFQSSTTYLQSSLRQQWERALSNFNGEHPPGSKYNSPAYSRRSRHFRPKTRSAVRRCEAGAIAAFFQTAEPIIARAENEDDPQEKMAAELAAAMVSARLNSMSPRKRIPWFQVTAGAVQSAEIYGIVCSRQHWEYQEGGLDVPDVDETGRPVLDQMGRATMRRHTEVITDRPRLTILAPENLRIDPAADWLDPINSSPYVIEIIPTYVQDAHARMDAGVWLPVDDSVLLSSRASSSENDSTRLAREGRNRVDRMDYSKELHDHQIVWVHRVILRQPNGLDYVFYTAGVSARLSDPVPLQAEAPWLDPGERDYAYGCAVIELHKAHPKGTVTLLEGLQAEANEIVNSRRDNVRLALNKRFIIRRGANIDTSALRQSVPGGAIQADDPNGDVVTLEHRDVTASAYHEQDRVNVDFDELAGVMSPSTVGTARNLNETVGGMNLIAADAATLTEHTVRTIVETWGNPAINQLARMCQYMEDDPEILETARRRAGIEGPVPEALLARRVSLRLNVAMGSTDPTRRITNLLSGIRGVLELPGADPSAGGDVKVKYAEVFREVFGSLGYDQGSRFFEEVAADDPRVRQLAEENDELRRIIETKQVEAQGRVEIERMRQQGQVAVTQMREEYETNRARLKHQIDLIDAEVAKADSVTKRGELYLAKEALRHQMLANELEFELKQRQMQAAEMRDELPSMPGKTGTMARDDYGMVEGQAG